MADRSASELLRGAYDCHLHAPPDVVPRAQDWLDVGQAARTAGLAGLVIKEHTGSTAGQAQLLNRGFPDGPRFFGSLTLNPPVGGLNPHAVAAALRLGAAVIFFRPTRRSTRSNGWAWTGFRNRFLGHEPSTGESAF